MAPVNGSVDARVHCAFGYHWELLTDPGARPPIHREAAQRDVADLVEEAFTDAVLSEKLPLDVDAVDVEVLPVFDRPPRADGVEVRLSGPGGAGPIRRTFQTGRWMRRAQETSLRLEAEGVLTEGTVTYVRLIAEPAPSETGLPMPYLQAPPITEQSMEELGVVQLADGFLCPDRPVLVSERMLEDVLRQAEDAGPRETGGGALGKIVRLARPLPGAATRIVTVLTAAVADVRHVGRVASVTFDPGALHQAAQIAGLRGRGEACLTVFHSHGWNASCGRCNQNASCPIPSASFVSLDDYQVLETLFPSKATLMPIAGRKLGAPGDRPVLEVHAWRGGRMSSIPWRAYRD